MKGKIYKMKAKVLVYEDTWYLLYLGQRESEEIKKARVGKPRRGWGSVRVRATIGKTSWDTSIFPSKDAPYLLLLNARVRKAEGILGGDTITVSIRIR